MHRHRQFIPLVLLLLCFPGCHRSTSDQPWSPPKEVLYQQAAVACDHPLASEAGLEMLRLGGNAVDAAVAASFTLSVVRPYSCGIGGGGFMVIADPAQGGGETSVVALNYRETAPAAMRPDHFQRFENPRASRDGVHAIGVPGTVAGLLLALEQYGTLDRATVLGPAIRVAEVGVSADADLVAAATILEDTLADHPYLRGLAEPIWHRLCRDGAVEVGDVIRHVDQARALRLIARDGADAFYRGPIGRAIVDEIRAGGGIMTMADLAGYKPHVVEPLIGTFRDLTVVSMPPPSSGGITMLQVFGILDRLEDALQRHDHNSAAYIHLVAEAMKHAFADRATWLADPNFVDVPTEALLDPAYLDRLAGSIDFNHTGDPMAYGSAAGVMLPTDGGTSHISVIDANGMAVACTETINLIYGSLVTVPGYGFVLNDEMDDFTTIPGQTNAFGLVQSDRNLPEPGKQPLSSMSPTIVLRDGRPILVAGASGGPRIINGTIQCVVNHLLFGMTPAEAVSRPRFHHQWMPNTLWLESNWNDPALRSSMISLGHTIDERKTVGVVQIITVDGEGIRAASDPRKGGLPAGN